MLICVRFDMFSEAASTCPYHHGDAVPRHPGQAADNGDSNRLWDLQNTSLRFPKAIKMLRDRKQRTRTPPHA